MSARTETVDRRWPYVMFIARDSATKGEGEKGPPGPCRCGEETDIDQASGTGSNLGGPVLFGELEHLDQDLRLVGAR